MAIKTLKNASIPDEQDCIFTSPDFKSWQSLLSENKTSLTGIEKRDMSRGELLGIASDYTSRMGLPVSHLKSQTDIIVTGHQPNWHHCGILAKNIITDKFARQTNGIALQLVLDHAICDTSMPIPEYNNNGIKTIQLESQQQKVPLELRPAISKEQLNRFIDSVSKIKNSFCSDMWREDLHLLLNTNTANLITQLQGRLNQALGLKMFYLPVSLMSESNSFINFLCSIICDAHNFIRIYNQAVVNRRKTHNLRPSQTMRRLKIDDRNKICEVPLWLISQTGKRASLYVGLNNRGIRIRTADKIIGAIDFSGDKKQQLLGILKKSHYMIRPKAVTLTLFTRLFLADLFIHGTGAGNYEYITDHLIRDFYKIPKLDFGIATATMTLSADYREFFFGLFPKDRLEKLICSQKGQK